MVRTNELHIMAQPTRTTITIDGNRFNAISTSFGISTHHDDTGMPTMGSLLCSIDVHVDINDTINMPFATLQALFQLANIVTRDKIKNIKIEFWEDDSKNNVICAYTFQGWIHHFNVSSSGDANHTLALSLQPALDQNSFYRIDMGN